MIAGLKELLVYFGKIAILFFEIIHYILYGKKRIRNTVYQMITLGAEGLPIVSLIALFTGIIMGFQTSYQLEKISSGIHIASLVVLSLTRELGPMLTSLIVAGRSGASISAEISSMKVTEQIDALKSLGTDPVDYLATPKFVALVLTLPLLVLYSDLVGILGGYIVGATKLNISFNLYMRMTIESLHLKDILTGLVKAGVFGAIIGVVCCHEGFSSKGGATGVGKSVINSVVRSFLLILTADCILTALFYLLIP
ncbi:MAG: ABC transporter permease [Candidatus Omnitrophica bacterium]|nr:ABC transporter permease [Candidatus Omnitrophota bacterium]